MSRQPDVGGGTRNDAPTAEEAFAAWLTLERWRAAQVASVTTTRVYTSKAPPAEGVRVFHDWCRAGRVHGALKRGRTWSCTVEAWDAARTMRATVPRIAANDAEPWSPEAAVASRTEARRA